MPTEEWMEKYEGMRDRLTCWTDPDSYFTGNMVGNTAVDAMDIGTVSFPSGRILACDPLIELEDRPPFMQTVSPGTYPVTICVMPSEKYGDRYACVKVTVSDAKPVRYDLAMIGDELLRILRRRRDGMHRGCRDPEGVQGVLGEAPRGG